MSNFEYGEFVNEPIVPLRDQQSLHLHDRDGLGMPLIADDGTNDIPDLSYAPGGWTPFNPSYGSRDGLNGLQGLPGKTGPGGMKAPPSKTGLGGTGILSTGATPGTIYSLGAGAVFNPYFSLTGIVRFTLNTKPQKVNWPNFEDVVFATSDPGSGQIWLSAT